MSFLSHPCRSQRHLAAAAGEAQTALRTKEEECCKAAEERVRLAQKLVDQADQRKAELQKLKEAEDALTAEFETPRSNWVEKEKALSDGYS